MRQLNPGENFPIARQIDDPSDSTTYYIRAYVRWADDDQLIETIDLGDNGDQRFRGTLHVPEDKNGGNGSYLTITTKVFTDAAYTIISDNYRVFEEEYLVFPRRNPFLGMGGAGNGSSLTAKQVRDIVASELAKLPPVDLQAIVESIMQLKSGIGEVHDEVKGIEIPKPEKVNLEPVLAAVKASSEATNKAIKAIPKPEPVDLTPITSRLDVFKPEIYHEKMDLLFSRITDFFREDMTELKSSISYIRKTLEGYAEKIANLLSFAAKGPDTLPDSPADYEEDNDDDEDNF